MRARGIKPGLYKSDLLAECSIWARFLFPGLWMLADRDGRLEDRPKRIKAELLPYDTQDVDSLLAELAKKGFIVRYEGNGLRCIWIPSFMKHQKPHPNEAPSVLPPYEPKLEARPPKDPTGTDHGEPEDAPRCEGLNTKAVSTSYLGSKDDGPRSKPLSADSLFSDNCFPDSPISDSISSARPLPGTEREAPKPTPHPRQRAKAIPSIDYRMEEFAKWYESYPRHKNPGDAEKAWQRAVKDGVLPDLDTLLDALAWQRKQDQWQNPKFIPHPATYLNRKAWLEEPDRTPPRQNGLPFFGNGESTYYRPSKEEVAMQRTAKNAMDYLREEEERERREREEGNR